MSVGAANCAYQKLINACDCFPVGNVGRGNARETKRQDLVAGGNFTLVDGDLNKLTKKLLLVIV